MARARNEASLVTDPAEARAEAILAPARARALEITTAAETIAEGARERIYTQSRAAFLPQGFSTR